MHLCRCGAGRGCPLPALICPPSLASTIDPVSFVPNTSCVFCPQFFLRSMFLTLLSPLCSIPHCLGQVPLPTRFMQAAHSSPSIVTVRPRSSHGSSPKGQSNNNTPCVASPSPLSPPFFLPLSFLRFPFCSRHSLLSVLKG